MIGKHLPPLPEVGPCGAGKKFQLPRDEARFRKWNSLAGKGLSPICRGWKVACGKVELSPPSSNWE
jgi:hypothetical protein